MKHAQFAVLIASLCLCSLSAAAQSDEKEPIAVVELGAAASRSLNDGSSGPTVAVEVTPIENWLELEAGVTPLFNRPSTEWDTDLLFKKPWTLSKRAEFMFGAGPEWVHTNKRGQRRIPSAPKLRLTLCSGRPPGTGSVGILNPASSTTSDEDMSSRSP
jgi:hypothetical protein